jgi:photosystem II stability/assembly factor-like uncharacterized protein
MRSIPLAALLAVCFLAAAGAQEWREEATTAKGFSSTYSASFIDESRGIGVGASGLVTFTGDGGQAWDRGINRSMCLFACQMLDASRCFATGNGGYVIGSKDGGRNWEVLSKLAAPGRSISFADESLGWAATKSWLGETRDGGKTWSAIPLPPGFGKIEAVSLASDCGYAVSQDGLAYRTRDSGATWEALASPFPRSESEYSRVYGNFAQSVGLRFAGTKGVAAVVCFAGGKRLLVVKTTEDGGATWSEPERHELAVQGSTLTLGMGLISVLGSDMTVTLFRRAD